MNHSLNSALIVFSGGQDSTTCLVWSLENFSSVHALSFDYGQRHDIELRQANIISKKLDVPHEILELDIFSKLSKNALTHDEEILGQTKTNLPTTFVPGRNLLFLSVACMKAYQLGIRNVVTGVCQTDYSGYPDCRQGFVSSLEETTSLAMDTNFKIHTPLMNLTKAESIQLMKSLGQLDLLKDSHTCYRGFRPACGTCPACQLRLKSFEEAGIEDPLEYLR